jgi:hypothetical protein
MEDVKILENSVKESTGVWGMTCKESVVRNWGGPPLHEKKKKTCKDEAYKP